MVLSSSKYACMLLPFRRRFPLVNYIHALLDVPHYVKPIVTSNHHSINKLVPNNAGGQLSRMFTL